MIDSRSFPRHHCAERQRCGTGLSTTAARQSDKITRGTKLSRCCRGCATVVPEGKSSQRSFRICRVWRASPREHAARCSRSIKQIEERVNQTEDRRRSRFGATGDLQLPRAKWCRKKKNAGLPRDVVRRRGKLQNEKIS